MVSLALLGAVLVAPARASDGGWQSPHRDYRKALTRGERADLNIATNIYRRDVNSSLTTLDYAKAMRDDGGRTEARRQFAAGWLYGGKKVVHLSKAERKKVMVYYPKRALDSGPRGTNCTGVTKQVIYDWPAYGGGDMSGDFWLDSCDTNWLKNGGLVSLGGTAGVLAGIFAGMIKSHPVGIAILTVVGTLQTVGSGWLGAAQDNSDAHAVIVKVRHYYLVWTVPQ